VAGRRQAGEKRRHRRRRGGRAHAAQAAEQVAGQQADRAGARQVVEPQAVDDQQHQAALGGKAADRQFRQRLEARAGATRGQLDARQQMQDIALAAAGRRRRARVRIGLDGGQRTFWYVRHELL
jgi:hypothetical protein